jgi:hypothetical protein
MLAGLPRRRPRSASQIVTLLASSRTVKTAVNPTSRWAPPTSGRPIQRGR